MNETTPGLFGKKGLRIESAFAVINKKLLLNLKLKNLSSNVLNQFKLQAKANFFGLQSENPQAISIEAQEAKEMSLKINFDSPKEQNSQPPIPLNFSFELQTNLDTFYFNIPCLVHLLFVKKFTSWLQCKITVV